MNNRERLLKVLNCEVPDCVPVCKDISNMIPARLTGKPFWDIYLYQDPPLWKAYIDGGFELYEFGDLFEDEEIKWEKKIVFKNENRIITQDFCKKQENGVSLFWYIQRIILQLQMSYLNR